MPLFIVASCVLELIGELVVDHVVMRVELAQGIPVMEYFRKYLTSRSHVTSHVCALLTSTVFVLWMFARVPGMMLCKDAAADKRRNVSEQRNGFEVWRVFHLEWQPQVRNRHGALLVRVLQQKFSGRTEDEFEKSDAEAEDNDFDSEDVPDEET